MSLDARVACARAARARRPTSRWRPAAWSRCSAPTGRQDDAAARAGRPDPAGRRPHRPRRSRARRPGRRRARAHGETARSASSSRTTCSSRTSGAGQRRLRPALARGEQGGVARAGARLARRAWVSHRAPPSGRVRSPAARRSASRWRGPWPPSRACSCSTSRSPPSTPAPAPSCGATSAGTSRVRRHLPGDHARPHRGHDAGRPAGRPRGGPHRAGRPAARSSPRTRAPATWPSSWG